MEATRTPKGNRPWPLEFLIQRQSRVPAGGEKSREHRTGAGREHRTGEASGAPLEHAQLLLQLIPTTRNILEPRSESSQNAVLTFPHMQMRADTRVTQIPEPTYPGDSSTLPCAHQCQHPCYCHSRDKKPGWETRLHGTSSQSQHLGG